MSPHQEKLALDERCSLGQLQSVEQAGRIAVASPGDFRVLNVVYPDVSGGRLELHVEINCSLLESTTKGIPLRRRETFVIAVEANFPFVHPSVSVPHTRFEGFPHVQWRRHLCIYQSPSTEWVPSDGMYGFLQRLYLWLERGAVNRLDPVGQPMHPPAIYPDVESSLAIIPRVNTPGDNSEIWLGFAHLKRFSDKRSDITGWSHFLEPNFPQNVAATILLKDPFPFEYPTKVSDLFKELIKHGVGEDLIYAILTMAACLNEEGQSLQFVIGTPMRGVVGSESLMQHLAVWEIKPVIADGLRTIAKANHLEKLIEDDSDKEAVRSIAGSSRAAISDYLSNAKISWCQTYEHRPEIVTRRDATKPIGWFQGKTIAIWGCGALGGYAAEIAVRAGVKKVILRDNKLVGPGVLLRQNYRDSNVGFTKVSCLANRLMRLRPDLVVDPQFSNLVTSLSACDELTDGDVSLVIDATASNMVGAALEQFLKSQNEKPLIASMAINHFANKAMLSLARPTHRSSLFDLDRKSKLHACDDAALSDLLTDFWPGEGEYKIFQPEPGCSDPTFVGSSADSMLMAGTMMNALAELLCCSGKSWSSATTYFDLSSSGPYVSTIKFLPDLVVPDIGSSYEVRMSPYAWKKMKAVTSRSATLSGEVCETGGLLFGQIDEATKIVWISDVLGPPEDSVSSPSEFVCGTVGTKDANFALKEKSRGSIQYIGMWHTHPVSAPLPSQKDIHGMSCILAADDLAPRRQLLLIVGYSASRPKLGAYMFSSTDIVKHEDGRVLEINFSPGGFVDAP